MKCSFCGNNVPEGSELCPECGMILSLDDGESQEVSIPEYTPNVFGSEPLKVPEPVKEPSEEFVIDVPEYDPDSIVINIPEEEVVATEYVEPEVEEAVAEQQPIEEPVYEEAPAEAVEETPVYVAPVYPEVETEPDTDSEEYIQDFEQNAEVNTDEEYSEYEAFVETAGEQTELDEQFTAYEELDETVKITPVIVPVEDESEEAVTEVSQPEEEYEEIEDVKDDDDDTYVRSGKKGTATTIVALCLLLVCLLAAGSYIVKKVLPEKQPSTTEPSGIQVLNTTEPSVTEPSDSANSETTESEATEPITEETTTEAELTTEVITTTEEPTTEDATVTEPTDSTTTTNPTTTRPTTTKPTTTRPTTTRPTTRPGTTKPSATKPSTTKPSTTTDPYGINDVEVKKPSKYLSNSYTGYTVSTLKMRSKPSASSEKVQNLGKGAEVKVLATENGYSYVYSTRFGTYGWVSSSDISKERPVESTTSVKKDTVSPDKSGSGETMYTTYSINLRLGPSTSYDVIKIIPINYPVKVIGYKSGVSGWAYVTDLTTGQNGWVSTDYIK